VSGDVLLARNDSVSRGDYVRESFGDEVNVAARLASKAAAGEVVLSESTVRKAGVDTADLEKRRLALKGKSEPMSEALPLF
jgi:class 3 adenylate cyclase